MTMNDHDTAMKIGSAIGKMKIDEAAEGGAHLWDLWPDAKNMIETLGSKDRPWTEVALKSARDAFVEYERFDTHPHPVRWTHRTG